ncbi:hypothetical protein R6Q59_020807 [Mikania micrantha]
MATSSSSSASFMEPFFCCDEQDHPWCHDHNHNDDHQHHHHHQHHHAFEESSHLLLPTLNHQDFFWEDEELVSFFTKEQLQTLHSTLTFNHTSRKQAVDWILNVKSHFRFTHLTAILAIYYLDRFLASVPFQKDKPWMIQLLAVTSLSLAAKLKETRVPSLLDLQVEDTNYLFEPKIIQKMELLVMSTLEWKMNLVTPISFLDHIVRRLGLNTHLHWDFIKKCEDLILLLVSDSRFVGYQPSVLATATILHVIDQVDFFNSVEYKNQLLEVLKTTKEKVKEFCNEMI